MDLGRWSVSLIAAIGVAAATLAAATIWLLLTDPVRGADTISSLSTGDVVPFVRALSAVIYQALRGLFQYL
jgi:hypothetical protein